MKEIVTDELKAKLYELFEQHDKIVEEQDEYIEQLRKTIKQLQSENTRLQAERDKKTQTIRQRLHALSYESTEWSHGEHPRVVELDEIDKIFDEMKEAD